MDQLYLKRLSVTDIQKKHVDPVNSEALQVAAAIIEDVRLHADVAVRKYAEKFGDIKVDEKLFADKTECEKAFLSLDYEKQKVLQETAENIKKFALAQMACLSELNINIAGGQAGHSVSPIHTAGCYAPGGRFPLPSSVLMTAVTARSAGVKNVYVASPKPSVETLAAVHVADADGCLKVGGSQAIAAFTYGTAYFPAVDIVVGPGNNYVTAAKKLVAGLVAIDMLAGPSELVVVADYMADPKLIAADLLAQAEHDPEASPVLVSTSEKIIDAVEHEIALQIAKLSTKHIAKTSMQNNGIALLVSDIDEAIKVCDIIAPEHLELMFEDATNQAFKFNNYGGLFIGESSAEVLGDYGVGPNHVLPTGGTARYTGGLSVFTFLRIRTWMNISDNLAADKAFGNAFKLAKMEGLEAHAQAALLRQKNK